MQGCLSKICHPVSIEPDEDSKAGTESAIDLVLELAKQFPDRPVEASSLELGAAAAASASSPG